MGSAYPLEVFYDGSCIVCSREIEVYRRHNPQDRLRFIDISAEDFNADAYDRSRDEFMAQMHVRDADGQYYTGVDAFLQIWQAYPERSIYRLFGAFLDLPGIRLLARAGYALFARYRYLLPKRKDPCASDSCNLNHRR